MPPGRRAAARRGALFLAAAALPALDGASGVVTLQGPDARPAVGGLESLTFVLAAATFLVVEALLVIATLRLWRAARAAPEPGARPPVRWGWELVWTALPALGLLVLGLLGAQRLFGDPPPSPAAATPTPVALVGRPCVEHGPGPVAGLHLRMPRGMAEWETGTG